MTPDTPALQALRAAGLDDELLSHGPVRSLVEAADARGVEPAVVVTTLVVAGRRCPVRHGAGHQRPRG